MMLALCACTSGRRHAPHAIELNNRAVVVAGLHYLNDDSLRFAVELLNQAIGIDSSNLMLYFNKTKYTVMLGLYDEASSTLAAAESKSEDDPDVAVMQGIVAEMQGDDQSAQQFYERGLALHDSKYGNSSNLKHFLNRIYIELLLGHPIDPNINLDSIALPDDYLIDDVRGIISTLINSDREELLRVPLR